MMNVRFTPSGTFLTTVTAASWRRLHLGPPVGMNLTFIIYGQDRARGCDAVRVVRPLSPLDERGRGELVRLIGRLSRGAATDASAVSASAARKKLQDILFLVMRSAAKFRRRSGASRRTHERNLARRAMPAE